MDDSTLYGLAIGVLTEIAKDPSVAAETRIEAIKLLRETANGGKF